MSPKQNKKHYITMRKINDKKIKLLFFLIYTPNFKACVYLFVLLKHNFIKWYINYILA